MTDDLPRLHRPRADVIEISDLLDEARRGKYELPDFQRDLAWAREDRIKFFDSIYRGFPIGDILLWDPEDARRGAVRFGPFQPAKRDPNPYLIVDGQQRLATLFGCLLLPERKPGAETSNDADWRFAFDADNKRIVMLPAEPPPQLLPLPIAIDTSLYLKWTRNLPDENREERTQAADDFSKALRTYRVPFYVVRTTDRKLLQEVFERVNNTGKALNRTDVFDALFPGSQAEEEDENTRLKTIAAELDQEGFGHIKADWLVQAIKPMVRMDPSAEFSAQLRKVDERDIAEGTPGKTRQELRTIHARLKQASGSAIELLREAGIRRVETLPYVLVFPPLVHFFDRFKEPLADSTRAKLKRFVWHASVTGARQRHRSTFQRKAATLTTKSDNAEKAVDELLRLAEVSDLPRAKSLMAHHDWGSGATRLVALALFELGSRDLSSGACIDIWKELEHNDRSPFRLLWSSGVEPYSSSSVNRIISTIDNHRTLGTALEDLAYNRLFPAIDSDTLASHAIPLDAWRALQSGNKIEFLKLREQCMCDVVDTFIKRKLEV